MKNQSDLFKSLSQPFAAHDIEWRIQRSGIKNGNVWAMAIPYITNRAIMQRLDEVFGPLGWKNEQKQIEGGWLCGISVYCSDRSEWVTKWDGSENTKKRNNDDMDIIKGGLSSSMKRAAVHWGIGRYLYNLDATFAECFQNNQGKNRANVFDKQTNRKVYFSWNAPQLPAWALPEQKKSADRNQWRHDQEKQQKEAEREQNRQHIKELLDQKQYPHEQFCQDWNLSSMDDIQLYNRNKMIEWISQIQDPHTVEPVYHQSAKQVSHPADSAERAVSIIHKAITPAQVQNILQALEFYGINNHDFMRRAGINQIGQLAASRFDGAMKWISEYVPPAGQVSSEDEQKISNHIDVARIVVERHKKNRQDTERQASVVRESHQVNGNRHQPTEQRINNGDMNVWERRDYDRDMFAAMGSVN